MIDTTVKTFTATIYVGLRNRDTGETKSIDKAKSICQDYVDEEGLCVTVKPTGYVYTDGNESGIEVGLIHYPRFPRKKPEEEIRQQAFGLAERLLKGLNQYRVSVVLPDETVMFSNENKV